jgi:hypothetical protein
MFTRKLEHIKENFYTALVSCTSKSSPPFLLLYKFAIEEAVANAQ